MANQEMLDATQAPHSHGLVSTNAQNTVFGYKEGSSGVPIQTRSQRIKSQRVADFPAISRREEQWKYTTSEQILGLDEDSLTEYLGDIAVSGSQLVSPRWVGREHPAFGAAGTPEDRPSAAAWESAEQAYYLEIPAGVKLDSALQLGLASHDTTASALHIIVEAKAGSEGTIIIDHQGDAVLSENIEIIVGDNAHLTVVSIQDWNQKSVHLSAQFAKLGRNANLKHVVVSLGGKVVRVTPNAVFAAPGSSVEMLGLYFADAGQQLEHRLFVDHAVPNCRSRVTYKGALQGNKAHTIWVGDVLIRAAAEGTDTYELNRNLLLTDGARADSVPNLEIETGQIEGAGHASASGRFDDDQLFYLQARGIKEAEARRLVVRGFLNEIIQQIDDEQVQTRLNDAIEAELSGSNS